MDQCHSEDSHATEAATPTSDLSVGQATTMEERFRYAILLHDYIVALNKAQDNRSHFLLAAGVALIAGLGFTLNWLWEAGRLGSVEFAALMFALALFSATGICSLLAIRPRTYDPSSPVHTSGIAMQDRAEFIEASTGRELTDMIREVARENHVVATIVEDKAKWVSIGIILMVVGMVSLLLSGVVLGSLSLITRQVPV